MSVQIFSRIPQISAQAASLAKTAVTKAAHDVEANAKDTVAVDTGALKDAIQVRPTGEFSAEVEASKDYAIFVEMGTSRMGAQPYMTPAAERVRSSFEAAMGQIVK